MDHIKTTNKNKKILTVSNLDKYFIKSGKFNKVLDNICFDVYEKDFFGVIGESGSGKSTVGKCIIRLYDTTSGVINFDDHIINHKVLPNKEKKWLCQNMSMIFQDPLSSLNPRKNVLSLIAEPLVINKTIRVDVNNIIKESLRVNAFFQNTYQWQDYNLTKKYLVNFYKNNIKLIEQHIKLIKEHAINESDNAHDIILYFLSTIIDFESTYKLSIQVIYEYTSLIKQLLPYNASILDNKKTHISETYYYEQKQCIEDAKKLLIAPKEYWDYKLQKDKLEQELEYLIKDIDQTYKTQTKNSVTAILNSLKDEMYILKQNRHLTTSLSDYNYLKVKILMIQETFNVFKQFENKIDYQSNENFLAFSQYVTAKVTDKYQSVLADSMRLGRIGDKVDKLINHEANETEIAQILTLYRDLYYEIENQLSLLIENNLIKDDNQISLIYASMVDRSKNFDEKFKSEIKSYQSSIETLNKKMEELKKTFIGSAEFHNNQAILQETLLSYESADIKRKNFVEEDNLFFDKVIAPKLISGRKTIVSLTKTFNKLISEYKKEIYLNVRQITKHIKTHDSQNKKYWINFLKREIKGRFNNLAAINFELNTYLDEVNVYRAIRTTNKRKILLYKKILKNIITRQYVYNSLNEVGLKNEHAYRYPHEFSGGQRQRIVIARALIAKPKLIIADEPISALDVSIQAQVMNIMKNLSIKQGITFLFIAHDLSMVRFISNRLIIMHKGRIVEKGDSKHIFSHPIHPYTKSLIRSSPELSKIHVDLASFNSKMDYDKDYEKQADLPEFYSVSDEYEHFVFATKEQIRKWNK